MRKLLAITFVSLLLTGSALAAEALKPKDCKATQSSQARVSGKNVSELAKLAQDYVQENKKTEVKVISE
ncbi:MAG: hypothetical protein KAG61_06015 [Bacteriovoracaceae bacterium]|nr:hypothetical protein [Bacteriovoracaceae bacterium]